MCGGTAIDPDEAALFLVHGTEEPSFATRALPIVDGATAAGITYEFYPLEDMNHEGWERQIVDGRTINDLMYEFLNRVLYSR